MRGQPFTFAFYNPKCTSGTSSSPLSDVVARTLPVATEAWHLSRESGWRLATAQDWGCQHGGADSPHIQLRCLRPEDQGDSKLQAAK